MRQNVLSFDLLLNNSPQAITIEFRDVQSRNADIT